MMKLDKLCKTKHPTKIERKNKEKGPKFEPKAQKLKECHKGAKEQIMF
jgi:hypothetical protein